jgi:large subunit ribosomal protein L9
MRVILLEDVRGIGKRGEVVDVKDGYGRNYLVPRKLAEEATEGRLKQRAQETKAQADRERKVLEETRDTASRLANTTVRIPVKVGETGRLFGAVTSADVSRALEQLGFNVDRKHLRMDAIKTLGVHTVEAHLHEGVNATLNVEVMAE